MTARNPDIRLTRRRRRILAVLLVDAPHMGVTGICAAADVWTVTFFRFIDRLEDAGLAVSEPWQGGHRFYRLTPEGKRWARTRLGLEGPEVPRG